MQKVETSKHPKARNSKSPLPYFYPKIFWFPTVFDDENRIAFKIKGLHSK